MPPVDLVTSRGPEDDPAYPIADPYNLNPKGHPKPSPYGEKAAIGAGSRGSGGRDGKGGGRDAYPEESGRRWFKALAIVSIPVTLAAVFAAFLVTTSSNHYTGNQTPLDPGRAAPTSDQDIAHSSGPSIQGRRSTGPKHHHTATPSTTDTSAPAAGNPAGPPTRSAPSHPTHRPTPPPTKPPTHSPSPTPSPTPTTPPPGGGTGNAQP